jgi:import inner membrane translocase subunit TIM54
MPRKITIFLAAPPGDSLRPARDYFHEYIKPILVAGGMDWEVIEGRKEGDVRAGLAEKIRKLRKRSGEKFTAESAEEPEEKVDLDDLRYEVRKRSGVTEWNGVQGDLVLGRNTWKEYIRGLHEGWLGPLDPPRPAEALETDPQPLPTPTSDTPPADLPPTETPSSSEPASDSPPETEPPTPDPPPPKPAKITPKPPYITPKDYPTCPTAPSLPTSLNPSLPLHLPHVLGFLNTPTRIYRFLTRRHLADSTGRSVAALVLATHSRPYIQSAEFASAIDPDFTPNDTNNAPEGAVAQTGEAWEQEVVLKKEEREWSKTAWAPNKEDEPTKERPWQERMVIDSRIGQKMRQFELEHGAEEEALKVDQEKRMQDPSLVDRIRRWTGFEKGEKKGWDMGLEGAEDE